MFEDDRVMEEQKEDKKLPKAEMLNPQLSKEQIAGEYMELMKAMHGDKPYADSRLITVTGTAREGSIGEEILSYLKFRDYTRDNSSAKISVIAQNADVTSDHYDFANHTDLIMCHGITKMSWLENADDTDVNETISINLTGSIRLIKQFVNQTMNLHHRKKIISIGSMAYKSVLNASAAYCASKAGLAHYMKCAAYELAPKGFDVYSVHPSNVQNAPMTQDTIEGIMKYRGIGGEAAIKYWNANNPRTQFLTKKEIAKTIAHLLFEDAGYMSGCNIELGGGQR